MLSLPDRKRHGLAPPARALAASFARAAAAVAWRSMHPAVREHYLEAPRPPALARLEYRTQDGWRASLLHVPAVPGGSGEPVVLVHALGFHADAFRYGSGPTLVEHLSGAGFSVYLLQHRGDRESMAPPTVETGFSFDDIVEHDLVAAFAHVRAHSGFPRVHAVGHGLGGQLLLAYAGRFPGEDLSAVVAICSAMRFAVRRSEAVRAAMLSGLLPAHWRLPVRSAGVFLSPWIDDQQSMIGATAPPPRVRGALHYAVEDVPVALLRQLASWMCHGSVVDRTGLFDYTEALSAANIPLLVAVSPDDQICPPASALAALETWGGPKDSIWFADGYGHLDPLLASDADSVAFEPIVAWLRERKRMAWVSP